MMNKKTFDIKQKEFLIEVYKDDHFWRYIALGYQREVVTRYLELVNINGRISESIPSSHYFEEDTSILNELLENWKKYISEIADGKMVGI